MIKISNPFRKINISTKLFLNYLFLFVIVVFILIFSFAGGMTYIAKHNKGTIDDVDMESLYENIYEHGIDRACKIEGIKDNSYIELLDENLTVLDEYNSVHPKGYVYEQKEFNKIIIPNYYYYQYSEDINEESNSFNVYYSEETDNILLASVPNQEIKFIQKVLKVIFIIFVLVLLIVIIIYAKWTSISLVRPIKSLVKGVNEISKGNYDTRIKIKSKNELGILKDAINNMSKKIEEEIFLREKAEKNRKRLILDISHDLKTPLTNIMGYSETIYYDMELDESIKNRYLNIIMSNSKKANELISDLFELSKIDSDDNKIELKKQDICEFIRILLIDYVFEIEENSMDYEFDIPDYEIMCDISDKYLQRAISNLIVNSIKYSGKESTIKVSIRKANNDAIINIEDNGIGIKSDSIKDIFEPFVRADSSRNSKTGGTGLGLAITRAIIKKHGGDIYLDPYVDKGCKFIITIPIIKT
ncbi:HAMP domain-containing sensor histidine kinase [Tepidibacter hydrothermalis]|uniref:histidine kinase n=1 Tax=Tepidibacter hydrothermalis TaxID=3036126 RepID=A0ABY8EEZ9_9FIRM|nr:HAMP domain-containing sensor histidine kinase [Tepidibacter hydrothermalis]WFD10159.1 HAMP domain-containing sensor histidine kinase [Tepidibacter hydrothermalis]